MQRRPTGPLPGGRRPYAYGGSYPQVPGGPSPAGQGAGAAGPPPPQYLPTTSMYAGVGMTMSNMNSSLRGGYGPPPPSHPQPQPPQLQRYWSADPSPGPPTGFGGPPSSAAGGPFGKASPAAAGLDLELNDILSGPGGVSASSAGSFPSAADAGDVFSAFPTPQTQMQQQQQQQQAQMQHMQQQMQAQAQAQQAQAQARQAPAPASAPSAAAPASARPRASRPRKPPASEASSAPLAVGVKKQPPTAAASSLLDEPPDLSTRKLDAKTDTCQYAGCPNRARVEQRYGKFCNRHVIVAPCGFPGCRDKAQDAAGASMCERHAAEGKDALHRILAARAQNVPVCRTYGCFKNDQGRGYCRGHEKLLMATGRLPKHVNRRRVNNAYTMCAYPACAKHSQRNHLCRTHGNLVAKQAQELAARAGATETFDEVLARLQKDIRRCSHPACTKNSQRDRLCTIHYYEKHNLGPVGGGGSGKRRASRGAVAAAAAGNQGEGDGMEAQADAAGHEDFENSAAVGNAIRGVERTRCLAPGCGSAVAFAGGLCALHGQQKQAARCPPSPSSSSDGVEAAGDRYEDQDMEDGDGAMVVAACRVRLCDAPPAVAGLCLPHLDAFQRGLLSIDRLTLESSELARARAAEAAEAEARAEAEAAEAAAAAAAEAAAAGVAPPKKYFCRAERCGRQAQKRGLCKRHFREREGETVRASQKLRRGGGGRGVLY